MSEINNPHDKFFKETFSRPELAQDFCQYYLPAKIVERLDLSTLSPAKDTFVDSEYQERFSDLLYTVQMKTGQKIYLYLLFEHKSTPDRFTLFQLLCYMIDIWKLDRKIKKKSWLPPILPLVIYHGKKKWSAPVEFKELLPAVPGLEPFLPQFRCLLFDLNQMEEEKIQGPFMLRVVLYLLKYIQQAILPRKLKKIDEWVLALGPEREKYNEFLDVMLKYLYYGTDQLSPEQIQEELRDVLEKRGDMEMPTPAEVLLERGRIKGIEEGEQRGELRGTKDAIVAILETRFGNPSMTTLDLLSRIENITQLYDLRKLSLTASTLDEFEQVLRKQC